VGKKKNAKEEKKVKCFEELKQSVDRSNKLVCKYAAANTAMFEELSVTHKLCTRLLNHTDIIMSLDWRAKDIEVRHQTPVMVTRGTKNNISILKNFNKYYGGITRPSDRKFCIRVGGHKLDAYAKIFKNHWEVRINYFGKESDQWDIFRSAGLKIVGDSDASYKEFLKREVGYTASAHSVAVRQLEERVNETATAREKAIKELQYFANNAAARHEKAVKALEEWESSEKSRKLKGKDI